MNLSTLNAKSAIALMLCTTVCVVILTFVIGSMFYPPNTINETSRVKIFELLTFIIGIVSGYLLGKGESPPAEGEKK